MNVFDLDNCAVFRHLSSMRGIVGLDQFKCMSKRVQVGKVIVPDDDVSGFADVVL